MARKKNKISPKEIELKNFKGTETNEEIENVQQYTPSFISEEDIPTSEKIVKKQSSPPPVENMLFRATSGMRQTAQHIRTVAESMEGIVNSLEILIPVVQSMSKEYVRSLKNKQKAPSKSELNKYTRSLPLPVENEYTSPNYEQIQELLNNPLVKSIMQSLNKVES